jgi:hypothetical protein
VDWGSGRGKIIVQLQERVRESGTFVDRAIVREIKIASERFGERHSAWVEVMDLTNAWEQGRPDLKILEAIRQINRSASCWRAPRAVDQLGT